MLQILTKVVSGTKKGIKARLNPRLIFLRKKRCGNRARILDVGAGPTDAALIKEAYPKCWLEAVNIWFPDAATKEYQFFDHAHKIDLNTAGPSILPGKKFDYVISSHTIEHLKEGEPFLRGLCTQLLKGAHLYLEWPSPESETFPLSGFGLNFYDDHTHIKTYSIKEVTEVLQRCGLDILDQRRRRIWFRIILAPFLIIHRSIKVRRFVLYDLWDVTGFCNVVEARKR